MVRPPLVLGMMLCENVVMDEETLKVSVFGAFSGLGLESFPGIHAPFCAFAALTAGKGEATFRLGIDQFDEHAQLLRIYTLEGTLQFFDPLQTVYWLVRVTQC